MTRLEQSNTVRNEREFAPTHREPKPFSSRVESMTPGAFIFRGVHAEDATTVQHGCNLNILDRVCQENNRHGREFIGAMKPRRVLYESQ